MNGLKYNLNPNSIEWTAATRLGYWAVVADRSRYFPGAYVPARVRRDTWAEVAKELMRTLPAQSRRAFGAQVRSVIQETKNYYQRSAA